MPCTPECMGATEAKPLPVDHLTPAKLVATVAPLLLGTLTEPAAKATAKHEREYPEAPSCRRVVGARPVLNRGDRGPISSRAPDPTGCVTGTARRREQRGHACASVADCCAIRRRRRRGPRLVQQHVLGPLRPRRFSEHRAREQGPRARADSRRAGGSRCSLPAGRWLA